MARVPKVQKLTFEQTAQQVLLKRMVYTLNGNYKGYRQATIEYAELASKNFDKLKNVKPPKATIPFIVAPFYILRYIRIHLMDLFRKKTPAEKAWKNLVKSSKLKLNA